MEIHCAGKAPTIVQHRLSPFRLGEGLWGLQKLSGSGGPAHPPEKLGHQRLAKRDRIHFTQKGYELKGDLFFNAFLKSYDNFINQENTN